MKELGESFSILRRNNGVSINEASHDLGITEKELEAIEKGNFKVFKDVFELKKIISNYAKYLGLDEEKIVDEFNDFMFEKTSKISKEEIENFKVKKEEKEDRVSSPYTKVSKTRYDFAPIVLLITILVFISLVVYLVLSHIKNEEDIKQELVGNEVLYELT